MSWSELLSEDELHHSNHGVCEEKRIPVHRIERRQRQRRINGGKHTVKPEKLRLNDE